MLRPLRPWRVVASPARIRCNNSHFSLRRPIWEFAVKRAALSDLC